MHIGTFLGTQEQESRISHRRIHMLDGMLKFIYQSRQFLGYEKRLLAFVVFSAYQSSACV